MKKDFTIKAILVLVIIVTIFLSPLKKLTDQFFWQVVLPISGPLSKGGQRLGQTFSFWREIANLRHQNSQLAKDLSQLQVDRSKINELEHENELLRRELGFLDTERREELMPARIIGRDSTTFLSSLIIDKGKRDGLETGMAVISEGALIGQISRVEEKSSQIILLTSKDSLIQAMLQNSRSMGVLKGGVGGLTLENISQDTEFMVGEYVVTSGLGGRLKEGLLIGKAKSIQSAPSSLFKNIAVEPIVDLSHLELIFVMKKSVSQ